MDQPPLIVYLDTQDYSKFADIEVGRAAPGIATTFEKILELKEAGKAIFAYSMPILSELLQYDPGKPEITHRKAKLIEKICGPHTFAHPQTVMGFEIASAAFRAGRLQHPPARSAILSADNRWFPPLDLKLTKMADLVKTARQEALAKLPLRNGYERRVAKSLSRKFPKNADLEKGVEAIASEFPLSRSAIRVIAQEMKSKKSR